MSARLLATLSAPRLFSTLILATVMTAGWLAALPAEAATVDVAVSSFTFTPRNVTIQVGDTIRWTNTGGFHNAQADDGSFRCANGCDGQGSSNGSAASNNWVATRTFNQPGTIGYFCEAHGGPGGAGMSGTITVQGDSAPAAPTQLSAAPQSTTQVQLSWTDASSNETEFRIERRTLAATAFTQVATAPAGSSGAVVSGLTPATGYIFRVRAANAGGVSAPSNEAAVATNGSTAPCVPDGDTLCLNNNRFQVNVVWRTATGTAAGTAIPLPFAPDSGLFYFFNPTNIEMLVKVLNACVEPFNRYWVFFAATTNVELTLTVTDTLNGRTRVYFNPLNQAAAPVQDSDAFATCP